MTQLQDKSAPIPVYHDAFRSDAWGAAGGVWVVVDQETGLWIRCVIIDLVPLLRGIVVSRLQRSRVITFRREWSTNLSGPMTGSQVVKLDQGIPPIDLFSICRQDLYLLPRDHLTLGVLFRGWLISPESILY